MTKKETQKALNELGFDFPETEEQLKVFDEKFKDFKYKTDHMRIDPNKIIEQVKKEANKYQEFFDFMLEQHGLTLTISEMDEIIYMSNGVVKRAKRGCNHGDFSIINGIFQCKKCGTPYMESKDPI